MQRALHPFTARHSASGCPKFCEPGWQLTRPGGELWGPPLTASLTKDPLTNCCWTEPLTRRLRAEWISVRTEPWPRRAPPISEEPPPGLREQQSVVGDRKTVVLPSPPSCVTRGVTLATQNGTTFSQAGRKAVSPTNLTSAQNGVSQGSCGMRRCVVGLRHQRSRASDCAHTSTRAPSLRKIIYF